MRWVARENCVLEGRWLEAGTVIERPEGFQNANFEPFQKGQQPKPRRLYDKAMEDQAVSELARILSSKGGLK